MKVHTDFVFSDEQRRSIRAALGRGGAATRKECRIFISRAVEAAMKAAPEAKPKRRPVPKPAPPPPPVDLTDDEEREQSRLQREKIRKLYRLDRPTTA